MKCLGLANNFTRTANASRALLHRVQAARRKHEAIPANCEKDCWTEEALVSFMAQAHRKTMPPAAAQPTLPHKTPRPHKTPCPHKTPRLPTAPDPGKTPSPPIPRQSATRSSTPTAPRGSALMAAFPPMPPTNARGQAWLRTSSPAPATSWC